jgi:hypothetical protein
MPFFETKGGIFRVPLAWREPDYKIGLRWPTGTSQFSLSGISALGLRGVVL